MKHSTVTQKPSVCVVVVVKNRKRYTKRFLKLFTKSTYKNYKIVIVDDGSTDGTSEYISKHYPDVIILKGNGNLWWTAGTNKGVRYALKNDFDYVLTINDDAVVGPQYLKAIVECATKHHNAIIGSFIIRSDTGRIWGIGVHLEWDSYHLFNLNFVDKGVGIKKQLKNPYRVESLTGDGTLIPTKVFKEVRLYNQTFAPHYHADTEMCLRSTKHGYKIYVCLDAKLINEISKKPLVIGRRRLLFTRKSDYFWKPILYLYIKYSPKGTFKGFFKQYSRFFEQNRVLRMIREISKIFRK